MSQSLFNQAYLSDVIELIGKGEYLELSQSLLNQVYISNYKTSFSIPSIKEVLSVSEGIV